MSRGARGRVPRPHGRRPRASPTGRWGPAGGPWGGAAGGDRGTVTAETALALPAVVVPLLVVVALTSAATSQLRCADAARAGARAAALGEETAVVAAIADRVAGDGASVQVRRDGLWVTVTVHRPVAAGPLAAGLTARASATARVEP